MDSKTPASNFNPMIVLFALLILIFVLAFIGVVSSDSNRPAAHDILHSSFFTGAGTVILAIFGYLSKELLARSADRRKLDFEVGKEERRQKQELQTARSTLLAEFKSLERISNEELAFVSKHTDPEHPEYKDFEGKPLPETVVPVMGFFHNIDDVKLSVSKLTQSEATAVMSAYFDYQEKRGYILKNCGIGAKEYENTISLGIVNYEFTSAHLAEWLRNDLRGMQEAASKAIKAIEMADNDRTTDLEAKRR